MVPFRLRLGRLGKCACTRQNKMAVAKTKWRRTCIRRNAQQQFLYYFLFGAQFDTSVRLPRLNLYIFKSFSSLTL